MTSGSMVDAHLEMDPEDVIEFRLDSSDESSKSIPLTLKNLDGDALPIAFKVCVFESSPVVVCFHYLPACAFDLL
jgi:hypothetical protein